MQDCFLPANNRKHNIMHIFIPSRALSVFPSYICVYVHHVVLYVFSCVGGRLLPARVPYAKVCSAVNMRSLLVEQSVLRFCSKSFCSSVRYLVKRGLNLEKHEHWRPGGEWGPDITAEVFSLTALSIPALFLPLLSGEM